MSNAETGRDSSSSGIWYPGKVYQEPSKELKSVFTDLMEVLEEKIEQTGWYEHPEAQGPIQEQIVTEPAASKLRLPYRDFPGVFTTGSERLFVVTPLLRLYAPVGAYGRE